MVSKSHYILLKSLDRKTKIGNPLEISYEILTAYIYRAGGVSVAFLRVSRWTCSCFVGFFNILEDKNYIEISIV